MKFPEELHYSKEHTWLKIENDLGIVGITEFAQAELGEIVYVDLPNLGLNYKMDQVFGSIEALKTVSDLFMPVSGKVKEVNSKLVQDPKLVNSDPYGEGWLIKMELTNSEEVNSLLSGDAYSNETGN